MTGAATGDMLKFSVVNDLRGISSAAARIDAFCAAHGLAPGIYFGVTLDVDELLTDTIGYGYNDGREHSIDLVLRIESDTLTVEIVDDGGAFDPLQAQRPELGASLQDRARGGLGIYLARKTMDAVAYRRQDSPVSCRGCGACSRPRKCGTISPGSSSGCATWKRPRHKSPN